ncbi:MAG: pilus assembly protein TadG-related protein [Paracoccaceae bacterium]
MMMIFSTNERPALKRLVRGSVLSAKRRLRQFGRDEDGALIIFALVLFFLMVMMGGVSVDLMRHEAKRTTLQQTLDRAVLAAASLQQELDPEAVVRDYFDKAGMTQYLNGVTVDEGMNYRVVDADASADTNPFFMHMVGVEQFDAFADSGAEQRISNVEISMVLDISGSMKGSRITALRPAARDFIDTVIGSSEPGRVTVSIVPYQSQVQVGDKLMNQFIPVAQRDHSSSFCMDLTSAQYTAVALPTSPLPQQAGHFDAESDQSTKTATDFFCQNISGNVITPLSADAAYLKGRVNAMAVDGWTAIDIGMKWGALLLDPASQPVVSGLIAAGAVEPEFEGRPLDPEAENVLKVVVIMSDGENTTELRLKPGYYSGDSNIYKRTSNGALSLYHAARSGTTKYYWLSDSKWHTAPDGGLAGSTRLTYPQLWKDYTVKWVAKSIYSKALNGGTDSGANTWYNNFVQNDASLKNARLSNVCSAARAKGIVVFAIGFEAPVAGRTALRDCASPDRDQHYFNASTVDIGSAFSAIANQISNLRLTQ